MDFFSFEEVALRLKKTLGIQTDKDLAALLGLDVSAYNKRKARGSFPEENLRALAQQRPDLGIDVGYVLTGAGREGVTSAEAMAWQDAQRANDNVAQRLARESGGLQGGRPVPRAAARAAALPPPDEAQLLAAYRGADAKGKAAILLMVKGIAALEPQPKAKKGDQ